MTTFTPAQRREIEAIVNDAVADAIRHLARAAKCPQCKNDSSNNQLCIHQVSARTGHSPSRIRQLRVEGHPLYDRMWKNGPAATSPLLIEEPVVDGWVEQQRTATRRSA